MMEHTPLTKQRSSYIPMRPMEIGDSVCKTWRRNVGDGSLVVLTADEPGIGWHLSISFRNHKGELTRYPKWDEIMHARLELLPLDIDFVMFLPKEGEYVALHDTTFHLHQFPPPGDAS
jgi:hypothetical protein